MRVSVSQSTLEPELTRVSLSNELLVEAAGTFIENDL